MREMEFTRDLTLSLLTERRALQPYGMQGGHPGAKGVNLLHIRGVNDVARTVSIGAKRTVSVYKGDRVEVLTPGGGGWGSPSQGGARGETTTQETQEEGVQPVVVKAGGSLGLYAQAQQSV